jgi:hypothetical protein
VYKRTIHLHNIHTINDSKDESIDYINNLSKYIIGNEFHFLFKCEHPEIKELRLKYIPTYYTTNPSDSKIKGMLSLHEPRVIRGHQSQGSDRF